MLPTWVADGGESTSATAVTPSMPAGIQAGDILLLFAECDEQSTIALTTANGFAAMPNSPQVASIGGGPKLYAYWKRAVGSDSAPTVTVSGGTVAAIGGLIVAVRGCISTGNPWNVTSEGSETTEDTSLSIPGATTTVADCLVVAVAGICFAANSTTMLSGWANSDLANVTERFDRSILIGNGIGFGIATGEKATAGAYGATTATVAAGDSKAYMTFALKPEPPPAGSTPPFVDIAIQL